MQSRKLRLMIASLVITGLAACDGLKNCSTTAISTGIMPIGWTHTCNATFSTISEWQEIYIGFEDVSFLTSDVMAEITVTVESGEVELLVYDSNGQPVEITARPGEPAVYSARADRNRSQGVEFILTPLNGAATNVRYVARFTA
jgi:hypothetical protein